MRLPIRFLLFFTVLLGLFTFLPKQIFAQTPSSNPTTSTQSASALGTDSDVPTNLHNVTQVLMIETMSGVLCQITGVDYLHPDQKCLGLNTQTGKIGFVGNGGGMIGALGTMISATMTPPISSGQYISYLRNNFGIVKHVYAADNSGPCADPAKGIGFCGLWPVVNLWIGMRNIVYLILILAFVVIGVGIMLRLHIDPQTVMTVQNQIPKIIIGIIGITFSFAIAGFLIDIMWVATYLFGSVISNAAGGASDFQRVVLSANPFDAANNATANVGSITGITSQTSSAFTNVIKDVFSGPAQNFGNGNVIMGFVGDVIFTFINILAWIIIGVAIIVALIRLWVTLILAYLNIILDVVFAPFWILAGVVPGSPISLGSWLRDLVANLSVFPMTVSFFLLADIFIQEFQLGGASGRFVPPLVGGVSSSSISALIGLGFILMLPHMLTTMKAALKAPKLDFGPLLGPIGAGARTLTGAVKGYGATQVASKEWVAGPNGFEQRKLGRAFVGRIFGGR